MEYDIQQLTSQQLAKRKITDWIEKSNLYPGDKIQSQNQMAKLLKIGPATAHNALRELAQEGILYRIKGKGTFLKSTYSKTQNLSLALVIPRQNIDSPAENPDSWFHFQIILKLLIQSLGDNGILSTVICHPDETINKVKEKLRGYDAVVFLGDREFQKVIEEMLATKIIQLFIISPSGIHENCLTVRSNAKKAVWTGINNLISWGHRKIAFLGTDAFDDKYNGYRKALSDHGIPYDENLVVRGINHCFDARRGVSLLISRGTKFDAVFVDSDKKAVNVVQCLRQEGIQIPTDISIMGYGESSTINLNEHLTTVSIPYKEMISTGINILEDWKCNGKKSIVAENLNIDGVLEPGMTCIVR